MIDSANSSWVGHYFFVPIKKWYSLHSGGMVLIRFFLCHWTYFLLTFNKKADFLKKSGPILSHNPSNIRQTKRIGTVRLQRTQAVSSSSYPLSLINKVQKYQQLQFGQVFTREERKTVWVSVSEPFLSIVLISITLVFPELKPL